MLKSICSLCFLFLVACSPVSKETVEVPVLNPVKVALTEGGEPHIITYNEAATQVRILAMAYKAEFNYQFLSQDENYVIVDHEWMLDFIAWWDRLKFLFNINYVEEGFDCDNFADFISIVADFSNRKIRAELLIGSISVKQNKPFGGEPAGGYHALNFFVSDKGIFILEPQGKLSSVIELDKYPNKASIYKIDL